MKAFAAGLALTAAMILVGRACSQQKEPAAEKKEAVKGDPKGMMGGG